MQLACLALVVFLQFSTTQTYAQTEGSGVVIRVKVDGVPTDYHDIFCGYGTADWGGAPTDGFCATPAWAYDITPDSLACDPIPAGQLTGKIALIRRGVCGFSIKALNAQNAGAVAALIVQTVNVTTDDCYVQTIGATAPQSDSTTIPCFFASRKMGNQIDAALKAGKSVEVCFLKPDIDITDFFYPASSVQTPASQIGLDSFGFSVLVSNSGTVARTNVEIKAQVVNSAGTELHSTSIVIPELEAGVVDSFFELPGLYGPYLANGKYGIVYTASADSVSGAPLKDQAGDYFYVTPSLYAKEDNVVTIGYRTGSASSGSDWAVGNLYKVFAGNQDQYQFKTLEFAFSTNASELPLADVAATIYLFRINDGVTVNDNEFDRTEFLSSSMEWKGTAIYEAPSNIASYALQKVELNDLGTGNVGVHVDAGAQYTAPSNLTFNAFNENYSMGGVATTIFSDQWYLGGFGAGINAFVRLYLDLVTTTDEKALPESVMQIVPNPVQDKLNLDIRFDQPTDVSITVAELSGRVINVEDRQGMTTERVSYDLPQLASGTYLARIATKEGTLTKKFIVQR